MSVTRQNDLQKVRKDGLALKCVSDQSVQICIAAIQQNGHALRYMLPIYFVWESITDLMYEVRQWVRSS